MFTLVPSQFFDPAGRKEALESVAGTVEGAEVNHIEIPVYDAVLVYTTDEDSILSTRDMVEMLTALPRLQEYNKLICSLRDGILNIAIAQGNTLLLANSFAAPDFTTAQYYIFLAVKSLQINPEMSTISWMSDISEEEQMSLYRYFKSVVKL